MRTPRTRLALASVAAVAVLVVGACGGDDDDAEPDATEATAETSAVDETTSTEAASTDTAGGSDDTTDGTTSGTAGGEVGTREEYVEAAKAEVEFEDAEINDCVAEAIVSDEVYEAIQTAGLTVDAFSETGPSGAVDIDEAQAQAVAAEMAECGDLISQVLTDEAELACATENLSNEQLAEFLALSLFGLEPGAELQDANAAVEECLASATTTTG